MVINHKRVIISSAFVIAMLYFSIGYFTLSVGHPAEDAYILFKYVENMKNGLGIAYSASGERAEGATDFLWLIILYILHSIKIDVAVAALLANSLGAFIIAHIFISKVYTSNQKTKYLSFFYFVCSFIILFFPYATAGYVGFSTMLYSALILWLFTLFLKGPKKPFLYIPILSIIIALFRPDGVIIGVSYTLLGVYYIYKTKYQKYYLYSMALAFSIGVIYFIWRYLYFGNLLPLPLYVKSHGPSHGFLMNIIWFYENKGVFILLFIALLLINFKWKSLKSYLVSFIPIFLLLISLSFATQSQNLHYRFQAPIVLIGTYLLILTLLRIDLAKWYKKAIIILLISFALPQTSVHFLFHSTFKKPSIAKSYIDVYPLKISEYVDENTRIVLTEAGKMAYWLDANIIDLVGLNTSYTAKYVPDILYISQFDPDIVMMHNADSLDVSRIATYNEDVVEVTGINLGDYLIPKFNEVINYNRQTNYNDVNFEHTDIVPIKGRMFLDEVSDQYRVFIVKYHGKYDHLFAFKNTYPYSEDLIEILKQTASLQQEDIPSYLELKTKK